MTNQRLEILNFLNQSADYPTAEQIYDVVKGKTPKNQQSNRLQ